MTTPRVPVVLFHTINVTPQSWPYGAGTEYLTDFVAKLHYLKRNGYQTITLGELHAYMAHRAPLPEKPIVLTLDGGFLDNWTVAFPALEKTGFKAVIFACTDFIDPAPRPRPTLAPDIEGVIEGRVPARVPELGYASWAELRAMADSGLVEVQSHSATHTWHFSGPRIIDYWRPGAWEQYPWMAWNAAPARKPYWPLGGQEELVPYGTPIYENHRALVARRYLPDESLGERVVQYVAEQGGRAFFKRPAWREDLDGLVAAHRRNGGEASAFETEEEHVSRLRLELDKSLLEQGLGRPVEFLCWPGGAYDDACLRVAREYGYLATVANEAKASNNSYGDDPQLIARISCGNPCGADRFPWRYKVAIFAYYLGRFEGSRLCRMVDRLYRFKTAATGRAAGI